MTRQRSLRWLALLLALVLFGAACGDDDSGTTDAGSSGGETAGGGGGSSRGVTDTEIKIAGLAAMTSPQGGYPGADIGAKARFERANREGGINGRKIDYLGVKDDGEDPTRNLDLARQLVQQDEVFALAPVIGQGLLPQSSDFLEEQKVPYVGYGFMPGFCGTKFGFGFNGCVSPPGGDISNSSLSDTLVKALDLDETSSVAIIGYDADPGRTGNMLLKAAFENAGVRVVLDDATVPTTDTTDFTPWVQKIMSADDGDPPTAVALITLFNNTIGLTGALKDAGYEGATMNYLTYVPGLLESQQQVAAAIDGAYVNTQWLPEEFGGSAIEQIKDDLEAIGEDPSIGFATSIGYWSADVLVQMLEAAGPDLTPERFDEVINGGFTYEPTGDPMGIGPMEYPRDHDQPAPCAALVRVNGTKYEPVLPMDCYEVIQVG
jgi:ABC-type branched-subunit amino acid transport system substrate-binding protein